MARACRLRQASKNRERSVWLLCNSLIICYPTRNTLPSILRPEMPEVYFPGGCGGRRAGDQGSERPLTQDFGRKGERAQMRAQVMNSSVPANQVLGSLGLGPQLSAAPLSSLGPWLLPLRPRALECPSGPVAAASDSERAAEFGNEASFSSLDLSGFQETREARGRSR